MSEVKSARKFLCDLQDIRETTDYNMYTLIDYVNSDRREIIERCRKAIDDKGWRGVGGWKQSVDSALDSVLSEIEKEE